MNGNTRGVVLLFDLFFRLLLFLLVLDLAIACYRSWVLVSIFWSRSSTMLKERANSVADDDVDDEYLSQLLILTIFVFNFS